LGRPDNALKDIDTALTRRPTYLCARAIKVVILKRQGKDRAAKEELKQCEYLLPKDSWDFYCLSLAYAHAGKTEEAVKYVQTSIQKDAKFLYRAQRDPLLQPVRENPQFIAVVSS